MKKLISWDWQQFIKKIPQEKIIFQYLKYGYKSIERTNETFFKDIYKVDAGTNLIIKREQIQS